MGTATVPREVIAAALAKADSSQWWRFAVWQEDMQGYYVPSRTTPGEWYVVTVRRAGSTSGAWWDVLRCSCPTESAGRRVCWHKAAVYLKWRHEKLRLAAHRGVSMVREAPEEGATQHEPEWPTKATGQPEPAPEEPPAVSGGVSRLPDGTDGAEAPELPDRPVVRDMSAGASPRDEERAAPDQEHRKPKRATPKGRGRLATGRGKGGARRTDK